MKRETKNLIVAAQNKSIKAHLVEVKIDKSRKDMLCRLCKKADFAVPGVIRIEEKEKIKKVTEDFE